MIGSFWNLCRACPSMPVDKLHSEYRSTYRWHEYTGPRQEVVRRAPSTQPNVGVNSDERPNEHQHTTRIDEESYNELPKLEPALPRRKKHPDLAYRHHEFLVSEGGHGGDQTDFIGNDRARSMERGVSHWRPSRRSKSEGPARTTRATLAKGERRRDSDPDLENTGRDQGLLQKAISKISTEYRLQFAWPQGHTSRRDAADSTPRKSQSMNALRPPANSIIHHKRRADFENKDASELEPLVNDNTIQEHETAKDFNTEYKKKFRPFSQYEYSEGTFKSKAGDREGEDQEAKKALLNGPNKESWYKEVVELRKKAGEYKHRGWGSDLNSGKISDVYNQQVELWDQVSRRSSLSALSLASTTYKIYTKAEKDQENTKKSSPTKAQRNAENSARIVRDMIRHHLERTTGGTEYDGLILSPTRDKLEPTIPRKDDDSRGSQKNSPKKNSPQKLSLQKKPKSKSVPRTVRSQSVGPVDIINEKRSPKRQSRSATVKEKKTTSTTPSATRRPRPSSLNTTTASSRSKSRSVPPKIEDDRTAKSKPIKNHVSSQSHTQRPTTTTNGDKAEPVEIEKTEKIHQDKEDEVPPPEADIINLEPVVKSPPEPTRVKSPEQIIMRSPDPVNWTVPLDTGKTFTVTQNVREGDIGARPQSEVKAWTPPEVPPPIAQSAPPELPQQKEQARRGSNGRKTNETSQVPSTSKVSPAETCPEERTRYCGKPIKGTSLRCLDDPSFESSSTAKTGNPIAESNVSDDQGVRSFASDVLEKARNRFDSFWRKNSTEEST